MSPSHEDAERLLAKIQETLRRQGETELDLRAEVVDALERMLHDDSSAPRNLVGLEDIVRLRALDHWANAYMLFRCLHRIDQGSASAHDYESVAELLVERDEPAGAIDALRQALAQTPATELLARARVRLKLAETLRKMGRADEAREELGRAAAAGEYAAAEQLEDFDYGTQ